jgi:redox-sensitive bicupin YhaK (pirin superfamily)
VFVGGAAIAGEQVARGELAVLGRGERFEVEAGAEGARLVLVAGRPLHEPVAKYGPFVMNTADEIRQAVYDYQSGKF